MAFYSMVITKNLKEQLLEIARASRLVSFSSVQPGLHSGGSRLECKPSVRFGCKGEESYSSMKDAGRCW